MSVARILFRRGPLIRCFSKSLFPNMSSVNATAWESVVNRLKSLKSFRLHTGNMNNYVELKTRRYKSSSEELVACLDMQFANLSENVKVDDDGTLLLSAKETPLTYDRDDLKITLKVFINEFSVKEVDAAVAAVLTQLKIDSIEQLIIDFPHPGDDEIDNTWVEKVVGVWKELEQHIQSGKIISIGVADFNLHALKELVNNVDIKPCVNHFSVDGCCVVPPELQAFAQENDIQLLTHNDPHPFPLREVFQTICTLNSKAPVCREIFVPTWAARYTVWIRRRSIMASKGYIVQFESTA
uniref:GCS light chain n=1 Tax=Panagrellus redivivus TaxID=6233 RepID=A0A7E4V394_PANRE